MEFSFHENGHKKHVGAAILISKKTNFKTKLIKREREGNFILIKGELHEDYISIFNVCDWSTRAPTYVGETLSLNHTSTFTY